MATTDTLRALQRAVTLAAKGACGDAGMICDRIATSDRDTFRAGLLALGTATGAKGSPAGDGLPGVATRIGEASVLLDPADVYATLGETLPRGFGASFAAGIRSGVRAWRRAEPPVPAAPGPEPIDPGPEPQKPYDPGSGRSVYGRRTDREDSTDRWESSPTSPLAAWTDSLRVWREIETVHAEWRASVRTHRAATETHAAWLACGRFVAEWLREFPEA